MSLLAHRAHLRLIESGMLPIRTHEYRPPPEPVIDEDFRARARQLVFEQGKTYTEAANLLRVHRQTVANICTAGDRYRPRQRRALTS